jgi:hypothetical protein
LPAVEENEVIFGAETANRDERTFTVRAVDRDARDALSDSARLVSGNLPISSAEMASTTPCAFRLMSIDWRSEARMPVMTIWSPGLSADDTLAVAGRCSSVA